MSRTRFTVAWKAYDHHGEVSTEGSLVASVSPHVPPYLAPSSAVTTADLYLKRHDRDYAHSHAQVLDVAPA